MSTDNDGFVYLRHLDADAIEANRAAEQRFSQELIGSESGVQSATVNYIAVPVGSGSPAGLHTHEWDQMFYGLLGSLSVEVGGALYNVQPGSMVVFPAGVPHRNWNEGTEQAVYLAINVPVTHASGSGAPS